MQKSFQRMMSGKQSVTSLQTNESRPMSPFDVEPEPASPPAAAPLAENAPLNPNRRKSIKMEDLPPEKSLDTGLIARITSKGEVEVRHCRPPRPHTVYPNSSCFTLHPLHSINSEGSCVS